MEENEQHTTNQTESSVADKPTPVAKADRQTASQLRSFIERLERLEDEKSELSQSIRDIFAEAKGFGFDPKVMKQVLKLRKMKREEYLEQEQLLETYLSALGMG